MDAHQTSVYAVVIISSVILGTIILFFIFSIIHHQRRAQQMYKNSVQAEINTLERERKRMAADLHDELGPVLSAIKFKVASIDTSSAEDEETIETVYSHIDTLIVKMREISNDLMPQILVHKGVVAALEDYISDLSKPSTLHIHFAHQAIPALSLFQSIHIYRIAVEIIHNTLKHAGATALKIELKNDQHQLVLQTRDNGQGFDYYIASRKTRKLGLRNIASRAEMLGAGMLTETSPGKGTSYIFNIPYTPHQQTV